MNQGKIVGKPEVREINFAPGQETGRHLHPCAVVGYIGEGSAVIQIEGGAAQSLDASQLFTSLRER